MEKIKVLIVEDSPLMAGLIQSMLLRDPEMEVVGIAVNGVQALEMVEAHKPDIITMDVEMPIMDGMEATKQIMARFPTPILVLSSTIFGGGQTKVFQIISYGALEALEKESFLVDGNVVENVADAFVENVRMLSKINVLCHPLASLELRQKSLSRNIGKAKKSGGGKILGIAASTGGPMAVAEILKPLPKEYPVPIAIVVHISDGFIGGFVEWLDGQVTMDVRIAGDGDKLMPGVAYVAPSHFHMCVTAGGNISLKDGDTVCGMMPSATVLFQSIAEVYGDRSCGVILTGMGRDGAEGLKEIHDSKGFAIAQDEESCVIFGMPKAAMELGAVDEVLGLADISKMLMSWGGK
jgi:two-component system, chemotaxis family, protein-glutamate methylesterase/glutaminase